MAKMNRKEIIAKLRLLNRDAATEMFLDPASLSTIYLSIDPSTLILGDAYLGTVFEWDNPEHTVLKVVGDDADGFKLNVRERRNLDPTVTPYKLEGPNSAVLKKTNDLARGLLVPTERRIAGESYSHVFEDFFILDSNKDKYEALMQLGTALDMANVFTGTSDDVLEMAAYIRTEDGKTPFPMYINKASIPTVLKYINVLKTFKNELDLPNELYQMELTGLSTYAMKNLGGSTTPVPEPKKAAETIKQHDERLKAHYGITDLTIDPTTGVRKGFDHEKMDFSTTVNESPTVVGVNPTSNGDPLNSVVVNPTYESAYYRNYKEMQGRTRGRLAYDDDGYGAPVRAEEDFGMKTKIANGFKTVGRFIKNHKGVIITAVAVAAVVGFAIAGGPATGALFAKIAKLAVLAAKQFILPIPQVLAHWFAGSPLTVQATWIAIGEAIGIVIAAGAIIKKKLKDRKKKRISQQQIARKNLAKWRNENAALQATIPELEEAIMSLDAELADTSLVGPERDAIQRARDRVQLKLDQANVKIALNTTNINNLAPRPLDDTDPTFVDREPVGGGLRF